MTQDADDEERRVTIGESAAGEDEGDAPSGLPPDDPDAPTVDDDPETQATG